MQDQIENFIQQVNSHKPIQYILGECEFYGRTFAVSDHVLIPRPETEELVREVIHYCKQQKRRLRIIDIGTGSGCIPITLALESKDTEVYATDVSEDALTVAKLNAQSLQAPVKFFLHDILKDDLLIDNIDVVVSNPPYITYREKDSMKENVLQFEPHLALFVPDDDPLLFYKAIVTKSKKVLNDGGLLAVEINERFGDHVATLFSDMEFTSVERIKDIFGKERIVKGLKT